MKFITPIFIETEDGSRTLQNGAGGSLYHSDRGARGEARHVYIERGFEHFVARAEARRVTIFEMGFGSGLNCLLTLQRAREMGVEVSYHAVEKCPVDPAAAMQYLDNQEFMAMHDAPWGEAVEVAEGFVLTKYFDDLRNFDWRQLSGVEVVYFDAFSPDEQPELWSDEIFANLHGAMASGGVVTTYSSKGVVKRAMRGAGFAVERLVGALGKRHMLRATRGE